MLAIALVSIIMYFVGILCDILFAGHMHGRIGLAAVMVMSTWNFNLPAAIFLLCVATIWAMVSFADMISK